MTQEEMQQQDFYMDATSRVRTLEGQYNLLRDRMLIINNNLIEQHKKLSGEIKILNEDIKEVKSELFNLKETMKHLIKELELFARKEDVKFLEKYINFWNPVNFVTSEELKKALEKKDG